MAKTALVTFSRNRIGYVITKSLALHGVKVVTADSIKFAMANYSKYSWKRAIYTDFHKDEMGFMESIIEICKKFNVDTIIPGHEESFVLSKHMQILKKNGIQTALPTPEQVEMAHDKNKITASAARLGIKTPKTYRFTSIGDFKTKVNQIKSFPVVIKLTKTRGGIGYFKAENADQLKSEYLKTLKEFAIKSAKDFPIVQQYIDGYGLGVSMLFDHGKATAFFTHKRVWEYPPEGGFSIERVGVHHQKAEEESLRLLESLKWHGVAMVEWRVDNKTDEPYFLEINPRFWGSLNQAVVSGVDFPFLTYQLASGKKLKPSFKYKLGIRTRWAAGMLVALPSYFRTKRRFKFLGSFLNVFAKNLHIDDISITDPKPFFVEFIKPLYDLLKGKNLRDQDLEEVRKGYC